MESLEKELNKAVKELDKIDIKQAIPLWGPFQALIDGVRGKPSVITSDSPIVLFGSALYHGQATAYTVALGYYFATNCLNL